MPYIRGRFSVGVGPLVWLTLAYRWVSGRALLLSRVLTQDMNLAGFHLFAFDPGQVGGENVTVSFPVQVDRHQPRSWTSVQKARCEAVKFAERSEDVVIANRFLPDMVASDVPDGTHVSAVHPWVLLLLLCFSTFISAREWHPFHYSVVTFVTPIWARRLPMRWFVARTRRTAPPPHPLHDAQHGFGAELVEVAHNDVDGGFDMGDVAE